MGYKPLDRSLLYYKRRELMKRIIAAVLAVALCMNIPVLAGDITNEKAYHIFLNDYSDRFKLIADKEMADEGEIINVMVKCPDNGYFYDGPCYIGNVGLRITSLLDYEAKMYGGSTPDGRLVSVIDEEFDTYYDKDKITAIWGSCDENSHYYQFLMPACDVSVNSIVTLYSRNSDETYNNAYDEVTFKLSCRAVGNGTVTCDKSEIKAGESYTYRAVPDPGYCIMNWIHYDNMCDTGENVKSIDTGRDGVAEWRILQRLTAKEAGDKAIEAGKDAEYCSYLSGDELMVVEFGKKDVNGSSSSVRDSGSSSERGGFDDKGSSSSSEKDEEGEDSSSSSTKKKPAKHSYPADAQPKAKAIQASGKAAEGDTVVMQEQSSGKKSVCSVTPSENGIITVAKGNKFTISVSGAADFASDDKKSVAVNKKGVVNAKKVTDEQGVNIKYSAGGKNCTLTVKVVDAAKLVEDSGKVTIKKTSIAINAGSSCNICLPDLPYNATPVGVSGKTGVIVNKAYKPEYLYIGKDGKWHFVCAGAKTGSAKYDFTVNGKKFTIKIKVNKTKGVGRAASSLNALRP